VIIPAVIVLVVMHIGDVRRWLTRRDER